ncbi:hypothetical protein [Marinactinospora rubrisoli]|uniref:Uncharacterized protein n=1 Tax=Marinactinospora rubrisoli TaxID=2715399 RepID=A0ABW2KLB9_9ACTN
MTESPGGTPAHDPYPPVAMDPATLAALVGAAKAARDGDAEAEAAVGSVADTHRDIASLDSNYRPRSPSKGGGRTA